MEKLTVYGLPLNPLVALEELAGASFCVSYATRKKLGRQLDDAIRLVGAGGVLLVDNGAYSLFRAGADFDESTVDGFEEWARAILARCPQAVAVIPDVIDGSELENIERVRTTGLPAERAMPVWHLNESLEYLIWLCESFNYVAFGSAGELYKKIGTPAWHARMREAFAAIAAWQNLEGAGNVRPRLHLMRAQAWAHAYPFDSSDSCNVAMNHGRYRHTGRGHVGRLAARVDARIQASAGAAAEHQIKRPLLEHMNHGDAELYMLAAWFDRTYSIERRQLELALAA